jgi:nicotinamide phosphoribosyltransferase
MLNALLRTDSYKVSHPALYPEKLEYAHSYMEARQGAAFKEIVFFGLQYYALRFLSGMQIKRHEVDEAVEFYAQHFGREVFDPAPWYTIVDDFHGFLPLRVCALPEGTVAKIGEPLMTIENTDPRFAFLPGWVETVMMKLWYPITIASQSYAIRQQLQSLFDTYSDNPSALDFAVHDFGYRGCATEEQAELGGAAHLLSFRGSDTLAGVDFARSWYAGGVTGFSIPALEHSVVLAHDYEGDAFDQILNTYPTGVIACVSDTYNYWDTLMDEWCDALKDIVLSRDGKVVIRPDSGDPEDVVLRSLDILWDAYGGTVNSKGLRVLDPHIGLIQGDGMDLYTIPELFRTVVDHGFAPENLAVGSGGGLLQKVNRDTLRFAYKVSHVVVDGVHRDVAKRPVGDKSKWSKAGRQDNPRFVTYVENGRYLYYERFDQIRERLGVLK